MGDILLKCLFYSLFRFELFSKPLIDTRTFRLVLGMYVFYPNASGKYILGK